MEEITKRICRECKQEWPSTDFEYRKIFIGDYGINENASPTETYIVSICPEGHSTTVARTQ